MLLEELQKMNVGRLTFMPLNRLSLGQDLEYPDSDEAIPMMSRISFKPMYRPAMAEIFRTGLVVKSLAVGSRFAKYALEREGVPWGRALPCAWLTYSRIHLPKVARARLRHDLW